MLALISLFIGSADAKTRPAAQPFPVPPRKPGVTAPASPFAASAQQYQSCMALARAHPDQGLATSQAWAKQKGGEPALHCGAVSLIGLQRYAEGAVQLEQLDQANPSDPPELRASFLGQAGQARLLAGDTAAAASDQSAALDLLPGDPDLLIDRAESRALAKDYPDALADLNQALAFAPGRVDALTYRAAAKRLSGDLDGAIADAAQATALDPGNASAWLEAANASLQNGDVATARSDWARIVQIAPASAAADDARKNLKATAGK